MTAACDAIARILIVAAPGSNHGKTLICAGMARALLDQGHRVALYKMGPDYLDPQFLEKATGLEVRQLDYWMLGEHEIAAELMRAAERFDYVLIEGVMGLFDGSFPVAKLAADFKIPVVLVIDASAMAQTFGAIVQGLSTYSDDVRVIGAIANRVGSDGHGVMLAESVRTPVTYLGWVKRDDRLAVESRHLGIRNAPGRAPSCARILAQQLEPMLEGLPWGNLSAAEHCMPGREVARETQRLSGQRIAIARDEAFSFLYHANIDFLQREGAILSFFSPLRDSVLPECDALYLPGGYPEEHAHALSQNLPMVGAIRQHISQEKPCLAECGGMLYLAESLSWKAERATMLGLLPGHAVVNDRLAAIGYQALPGTRLRGHTFHYASIETGQSGLRCFYPDDREGEWFWQKGATVASFVHWYFSSDPDTVCSWFAGTRLPSQSGLPS